MSEIYDNLNPKIAQHLDSRLASVTSYSSLLDPSIASNFLYEGAVVYVSDESVNYMVETVGGTLSWVKQGSTSLVRGAITLDPSFTSMNLKLVEPDISTCYAVDITIKTGSSTTIAKIENFPSNLEYIEFTLAEVNKSITFAHSDYDNIETGGIVMEDGFDMTLKGRTVGNDSLTLQRSGNAFSQRSAVQFMKSGEWLTNILEGTVVDNLTSTSSSESLSANQGRVLGSSLAGKQNDLTASDNISITGDVIKGVPNPWISFTAPSTSIVSAEDYITAAYNDTVVDYVNFRMIDLSNVAGDDHGKWVLPPGASGATFARWVQYDRPLPSTGFSEYTYKTSNTLAADSIGSGITYHPRLLINSKKGDDLNVSFNADGNSNEAVSLSFLSKGLYTIRATLAIQGVDVDATNAISKMKAQITSSNGLGSLTSPATGGVLKQSLQFPYFDFTVSDVSLSHVTVEATIDVETIGVQNGITLSINNGGELFTNVELPQDKSVLRITKHR